MLMEVCIMKLTTKARYGVRLVLDIANNCSEGPVCLKDISKRQNISEKYLWQLVSRLQKAGYLNSVRGAGGGYVLAKQPEEITLLNVVEVLEGKVLLVECVANDKYCEMTNVCTVNEVWQEVSKKMSDCLDAINFKELMARYKAKKTVFNYYI